MMPRALTVLCLLPLLAFGQWEMDFDEDFAAAEGAAPPTVPFHPTNLFPKMWVQGNSNVVNIINGDVGTWSGPPAYAAGRDSRMALSFGGSSSIRFSLYTMPSPVSNVTICAWVKAASFANYRSIFGNGFLGVVSGYGLYQNATASVFQYRKEMLFIREASFAHSSDTNWVFLVGVKSPQFIKFYVNGLSITNIPATDILDTNHTDYTIGANYYGGYPYVGHIQDVMLFDKELTPVEILQLKNWSQ